MCRFRVVYIYIYIYIYICINESIPSVPLCFQFLTIKIHINCHLNSQIIFDRCHHSLVALSPVIYEWDSDDLTGLFAKFDMMTSWNGNIFRVTGPLCGEFTGPGEFPTQRPVTRSFDVFFDLRLNKPLSKQSEGWWFETLSRSLWRHRNEISHTEK